MGISGQHEMGVSTTTRHARSGSPRLVAGPSAASRQRRRARFCAHARAGPIFGPARRRTAVGFLRKSYAGAQCRELLHLLGEDPERPVQVDAAVDAADRSSANAPPLRRATRLAAADHVLLDTLEGRPEVVPDVLPPARFEQLLRRDRCRQFALRRCHSARPAPLSQTRAPRPARAGVPFMSSFDASIASKSSSTRNAPSITSSRDVALVRQSDVVADAADDEAVAANEAERRPRASGTSWSRRDC